MPEFYHNSMNDGNGFSQQILEYFSSLCAFQKSIPLKSIRSLSASISIVSLSFFGQGNLSISSRFIHRQNPVLSHQIILSRFLDLLQNRKRWQLKGSIFISSAIMTIKPFICLRKSVVPGLMKTFTREKSTNMGFPSFYDFKKLPQGVPAKALLYPDRQSSDR
jgi:hypothetical protein